MDDTVDQFDNVERVEQLLHLFYQREATYNAHTERIIELISDPVVRVLCDTFNIDESAIDWEEVNIASPIIGLRFVINYEDADQIPPAVNIIAPSTNESTILRRTVAMGFPIIYATSTYEEFNEFFTDTVNRAIAKQKITTDDPVLTKDQQLQAYMHRPHGKVTH